MRSMALAAPLSPTNVAYLPPCGPDAGGGLAQLLAAQHVVGAQVGEPRLAARLAIDVRIDRDHLDAGLLAVLHGLGDRQVLGIGDRDGHGRDVGLIGILPQSIDLSLGRAVVDVHDGSQARRRPA